MLPEFYQKVLQTHLSPSQYMTLQLLVLMLQSHRQVKLSSLARIFPQPIQYPSRMRSLQRFLQLPQLSLKLLWHPIIKYWLRQEFKQPGNRGSRRKRLKSQKHGYVMLAIDRTQWKDRNLFVASVIWDKHALPIHWQLLPQSGSSSLLNQKRFLKPVLKLLKPLPVLVIGDRAFHSAKLAKWLQEMGVGFVLRQKKSTYIQEFTESYQALKTKGFQPGDKTFYQNISCNKTEQLGFFNLAIYWKRKYRGKKQQDAWYILTSLPQLSQTLAIYQARWGIEMMFKDCKSGGYNLEQTKVNQRRFLALFLLMVMAYSLATLQGYQLVRMKLKTYLVRCHPEAHRTTPRYSDFSLGLSGYAWKQAMDIWSELASQLMALKPHKWLYFQRGFAALSLVNNAL